MIKIDEGCVNKRKVKIVYYNFIISRVRFCSFKKIFVKISDFFEFQKSWTHNTKAMAKDKKVDIAVT